MYTHAVPLQRIFRGPHRVVHSLPLSGGLAQIRRGEIPEAICATEVIYLEDMFLLGLFGFVVPIALHDNRVDTYRAEVHSLKRRTRERKRENKQFLVNIRAINYCDFDNCIFVGKIIEVLTAECPLPVRPFLPHPPHREPIDQYEIFAKDP